MTDVTIFFPHVSSSFDLSSNHFLAPLTSAGSPACQVQTLHGQLAPCGGGPGVSKGRSFQGPFVFPSNLIYCIPSPKRHRKIGKLD